MTVRTQWNVAPVLRNLQTLTLAKARLGAEAAADETRRLVSKPYPPASRPGEPPRRRTGTLMASIRGEAAITSDRTVVARVVADAAHAVYLQRGTTRMLPRPFMPTAPGSIIAMFVRKVFGR